MSRVKLLIVGLFVTIGFLATPPALAIDLNENICKDLPNNQGCKVVKENDLGTKNNAVQRVLGQIFLVLGGVATIMIIYGGVLYAISQGEQAKVTKAKNTILYAVIGLIVALMAYAIVAFISSKL